jgi:predicted RNase H-like HicB family nuclease
MQQRRCSSRVRSTGYTLEDIFLPLKSAVSCLLHHLFQQDRLIPRDKLDRYHDYCIEPNGPCTLYFLPLRLVLLSDYLEASSFVQVIHNISFQHA